MAKKNTVSIKKQKKDLIVKILSVIAILVVIGIIYKFIGSLDTIKITSEEHELFQYVMGKKIEYLGKLEITNKNNITKLESNSGTVYLDSIPVYYKSEFDKAILPADMAIAFPMDNGNLNKISSLSVVYIEHGDVYVQKGNLNKRLEDAFLYDGNDLYFFIENTVVTINGIDYKIPPLSYVNATYKGYAEIYNYDTEEYTYIEEVNSDITAKTNKYKINLSNDIMMYEDTEQLLLKRIKNLPSLEN